VEEKRIGRNVWAWVERVGVSAWGRIAEMTRRWEKRGVSVSF
jgi:hypothetical protein